MRDISLAFVVFMVAFGACTYMGGKRVSGNGNVVTQQRNITDFTGVELQGGFHVYVSQGSAYEVKVEADENLMEYIVTEKDGDELEIHFKNNYNIHTTGPVKVYVTAPNYTQLAISGSGKMISQTKIANTSQLDIDISGSGDANLEVDAPTVKTEISGSGSALLRGNTRTFNGDISGSGKVKAFDLLSENSDLDITGSGDADVFASKQLDVSVAGSGNVNYKGNPTIKQSIVGSGKIHKAD